ncbi:MAG: hypothetical protein IT443_13070 [Phycisphaeraceae bacterium]|nr:hypothetical protein [Phycisphaeraceae bacterium]
MATDLDSYIPLVRQHVSRDYHLMYRQPNKALKHPYLTPGSSAYANVLWDWDSWLSNVALRQILAEVNDPAEVEKARPFERGCIQNYLEPHGPPGWVPIVIEPHGAWPAEKSMAENMHKPCLAQHAAFLVQQDGGDATWLREKMFPLQSFLNMYRNHYRHACGLYFWQTDCAIGVDNDPCTFGRPERSSGSIYLNCLMYRELLALVYLLQRVGLDEVAGQYQKDADDLRAAIQEHCWDPWLGFFYSVDFNLKPVPTFTKPELHYGQPRDWPCLIQRVGVWSGFLAMWAGIATPEQAQRMVREHLLDERTFSAPFGVRTLSKMEKMYNLRASGNPSSWLGPIWGVANYLTFRGLVRYGFNEQARELAEKTVRLFGRDLEKHGALHEYYQPENGEPILNPGFQNWNYLVLNMIRWLEGQPAVTEF